MSTKEIVGIVGNGNVGSALERGLKRAGYDVRSAGKDRDDIRAAVQTASVVMLAVPFGALDDVVKNAGDLLADKVVVDVTNALTEDMRLALGFETSGAEVLQKKLPKAKVAKGFNTVFAQHMDSGHLGGDRLSVFVASDDDDAKARTLALARAIGFEAVDAGPLKNARLLEPLGYLNIQLGYVLDMGTQTGFKHLHP